MSTAKKIAPISVHAIARPFARRIDREVPAGGTVADLLAILGLDAAFLAAHGAHVFVGDRMVPRAAWTVLRPSPGDLVAIRVTPAGGGGGGKDPGRTVLMLAVMVVAAAASYGVSAIPSLGAYAGFAGAMAGAAVTIGGSLLVNALVPIQTPESEADGGRQRYGIAAARNSMDPYGAVTKILGKTRTWPKYAAIPYTELVGRDQYLRCLFLIGKGRYKLSAHKIGDTALDDFTAVQIEEYYSGDGTNNRFNLFPADVAEQSLSVELTQAGGWQTRTTAVDTDELSLDVTFPAGIYQTHDDGRYGSATVALEAEYSPTGAGTWTPITYTADIELMTGYPSAPGAAAAIAAGQAVVGQSSGATGTVQHTVQVYGQAVSGQDGDGRDIYVPTYYTRKLRVVIASGAFTNGEVLTIAGGSYTARIREVQRVGLLASANAPALERFGWSMPVPRGQYDVRVRRTTADNRDDIVDGTYWTALRSVSHEAPVNLSGCTLVGMRIKATGQLNGALDAYNCVAEAIVPAHDGTGWNDVVTCSPAWAFAETLRGEANKRPVADARIDIAGLRAWAARCATEGRECNGEVAGRTTVFELLRDIAVTGRAAPAMVDNKFGVVEDIARSTPVQHFSPRNSWGFSGRRVYPDLPHAFRVRFKNAAESWADDERVVYDDGYTSANATRFETIDTRLITSAAEIWKLGRYWIAIARLRPEIFEFNVDAEHLVCTRGDLIRLSHDALLVGLGAARVKSISASAATFDDTFVMEAGKSYGVRFRKSDGSTQLAAVVTAAGDNTSVTFSPQLTALPAVGDLALFGEYGTESLECIVTRIDPGADLAAKVTCVQYDAAVYSADQGSIPTHDPGITRPALADRQPPAPVIETASITYGYKSTLRRDDGTYAIELTVPFSASLAAFNAGGNERDAIAGFQAQYRDTENEGWTELPRLGPDARRFSFIVQNNQSYDVRVRALSPLPGLSSDWDTESAIAIAIAGTVPPDVSGLQVLGGGTSWVPADCEIEWTAVPGGGTDGTLVLDYKVEVRTSDGLTVLRAEFVAGARYSYTIDNNRADGGPRAALQFRVWARSKWGDLSANYASLAATNPAPSNPTGLSSTPYMGGVSFAWTAASEVDFSHYAYRLKISTGSWGGWVTTRTPKVDRGLSAGEKTTYGGDATIYIEVKAVDLLGQESGASADSDTAGSILVKETDIDDFAITASKLFTKIPVVQNLTLTNNSPGAGSVAWSAHTIYYNGVAYAIAAGNTALKYIYWKDLGGTLAGSDTHPASISGWVPGEDFIIAVNLSGTGQQAWNAIANQVIGSAYIQNLGVNDAHIANLSGTKILATTSIAIGPASTFGTDGIQLEYNTGNPRFYAGDGSNSYIKFDGTDLKIRGQVEVIGSGNNNMLVNPGWEDALAGWYTGTGISVAATGNESNFKLQLVRSGSDLDCYAATPSGVKRFWEVSPGEVFEIGVDIIKTSGSCACWLLGMCYDKDYGFVGYLSGIADGVTPGSWTAFSGRKTIPAGARFVAFRLALTTADGTAHFDNAYFRKADALAYSWGATADKTKIDGGNIYASSAVRIGSTTYGAQGIQIEYNSGTPRFYCGNGSASYIKFDGTNVQISSSASTALAIKAGGGITLESLTSSTGLLSFDGGTYSVSFGAYTDGTDFRILSNSAGYCNMGIGVRIGESGLSGTNRISKSFAYITAQATTQITLRNADISTGDTNTELRITSAGAELLYKDFKALEAGKGIILTNAAGTVTKRCRLNDAGNGFLFDTP